MAVLQGATAAKAWTAAAGAAILTLIQVLQFVSPFLPGQWSWIVTAVVGVLTAVSVFFVPNKPAGPPQTPAAGSTAWPQS